MIYKYEMVTGEEKFNDSEQSLIAWASKSSIDRQDEEIDPNGWLLDHYKNNSVVPIFHDYNQFPAARAEWTKKSPRVNPEGLLFKPVFAKTETGKEAFYLYKEKFMNAFSVGFDPIEWQDGDGKTYSKAIDGEFGIWQKAYIQKARKKPRCKYLKQDLLEISCVLVPAHADALVVARGVVKTPELKAYLSAMIDQKKDFDGLNYETEDDKDFMPYIEILEKRIEKLEQSNTIDASEFEDDHIDIELDDQDDIEIELDDQDSDIEVDLEEISVEV